MKGGLTLFSSSPVPLQEEVRFCRAQCGRFRLDGKHLPGLRPVKDWNAWPRMAREWFSLHIFKGNWGLDKRQQQKRDGLLKAQSPPYLWGSVRPRLSLFKKRAIHLSLKQSPFKLMHVWLQAFDYWILHTSLTPTHCFNALHSEIEIQGPIPRTVKG